MRRALIILAALLLLLGPPVRAHAGSLGERFLESVKRNASLKRSWVPLIAAAAFLADGNTLDRDVSDWARENGIMGAGTANDLSDAVTLGVLPAEAIVTALLYDRHEGCAFCPEAAAAGSTLLAVESVKRLTDRRRPEFEGGDRLDSFPSGHTALAFSFAALSNRNIAKAGSAGMQDLYYLNYILASTVAWARIEAGRHYPSDVLAGASLGMFVSSVVYDTFLGGKKDAAVYLGPGGDGGLTFAVSWRF